MSLPFQPEIKGFSLRPDHGTGERWQHACRALELTDRAGVLAARAVDSDVLDRLVLAGIIDEKGRDAALRLRGDFQAAGLSVHVVGSYSPARSSFSYYGGWDERTDEEEAAYKRWREAVRNLGPRFSEPVVSVVCYDEAPRREKIQMLVIGLMLLAKGYGLRKKT